MTTQGRAWTGSRAWAWSKTRLITVSGSSVTEPHSHLRSARGPGRGGRVPCRPPGTAIISPGHSDNINFFGVINVDVEAELAKLDGTGWRPLRPAQLRQLGPTP
jgi:hypothetical protein